MMISWTRNKNSESVSQKRLSKLDYITYFCVIFDDFRHAVGRIGSTEIPGRRFKSDRLLPLLQVLSYGDFWRPDTPCFRCSIVSGTRWLECWWLGPRIHIWDYFWPKLKANKIFFWWCDAEWLMFPSRFSHQSKIGCETSHLISLLIDLVTYSMIWFAPQANKIIQNFNASLKVWTDLNVTCCLSRSTWRETK